MSAADELQALSKAELIRRIRLLEAASPRALEIEAELQSHQEEIRVQNEQLRAMQQNLENSANRYAELFDFAPLAYATLDKLGMIREINLTGATLLGMNRQELINRPLMRFVHKDDQRRLRLHLHECQADKRDCSAELRMRASTGREFPAQLTTHHIHSAAGSEADDSGCAVLYMAIADMTGYRRAEEERQNALLREQAARTAAETKDRLIAMISHELRTPLSAVLLWAKILQIRLTEPAQHVRAVDIIVRSAEAQRQLIDDLLDISRISSGKLRLNLKTVTLAPLIAAAVESVLPAARAKNIVASVELEGEVGTLHADSDRLQQVFWNLLSNAVKFTTAGGHIRVSARRVGDQADVRVSDDGEGIDATFLPHVFELFRQAETAITTRAHGGLGLGLAICKQLIEQHGGTIHVTSEGLGKGATFVVRLPLPAASIQLPVAGKTALIAAQPQRRALLNGLNVLVVEDESATRSALVTLVSEAGANVVAVDTAQAAIEAFQRARPDLIVGDIGLTGTDGYQMMQRLRQLEQQSDAPPVPALALTAFVGAADSRQALRAGFDKHLGKPIEPADLLAALEGLVGRAAGAFRRLNIPAA